MVDRQVLFSGTETPPAHLALHLDRLAAWLDGRIPELTGRLSAEKFKGGQSNPTYLVTGDGGRCALRRKPPGELVKSAHAIDREFRVMQAMAGASFPVAAPYLYCDDPTVIGSEFYIASFVPGRVCWEAELPGVAPADRAAIYDRMNAALAALHDTDARAVGLDDLGAAVGYASRNFQRWAGIYRASALDENADMNWLIAHLPDDLPEGEVALIHGDYGLYNIIIDADGPEVKAVLDWEMATLGDPLIDLTHHLRPWWDPPDAAGAATSLVGRDLAALGIPTMDTYIASYCARRGQAAPDLRWYLAYAQFRYAAMIQGILKRARDGTSASRSVLHRPERVAEIAALARRTLEGR